MAVTTISSDATEALSIEDFFDPDAFLDFASSRRLVLVSDDGYELEFRGSGFRFDSSDRPTAGTVRDVFLYEPDGDLVGRIDQTSFSLKDYYDDVVIDGRVGRFVADLMSGDDTITSGSSHDDLEGYGGNDLITSDFGEDILLGGDGNDTLSAGIDDDSIDGGAGDDRASGGQDDDIIFGGDGNDTLSGDSGDDEIYGEDDDDVINGGTGKDSLFGGAGDDTISGGSDNDSLEGSFGNDRLTGGAGNDRLGGGDGQDRLAGGGGRDLIFGDAGDDRIQGQAGNDTIVGGSGDDSINGGAGQDKLTGGSGEDQFQFSSSRDGVDRITDFVRGEDQLVFTAAGFANLSDDFDLVVGRNPDATSGNESFLFDTGSHRLYYDADGTGGGGARQIAILDDVSTLSKADFLIV